MDSRRGLVHVGIPAFDCGPEQHCQFISLLKSQSFRTQLEGKPGRGPNRDPGNIALKMREKGVPNILCLPDIDTPSRIMEVVHSGFCRRMQMNRKSSERIAFRFYPVHVLLLAHGDQIEFLSCPPQELSQEKFSSLCIVNT